MFCRQKKIRQVAKIVAPNLLMEDTMQLATAISTKSPVALRSIKHAIDMGMEVEFKNGCAIEADAFEMCFSSQDAHEGVVAFIKKRKPNFVGNLS